MLRQRRNEPVEETTDEWLDRMDRSVNRWTGIAVGAVFFLLVLCAFVFTWGGG